MPHDDRAPAPADAAAPADAPAPADAAARVPGAADYRGTDDGARATWEHFGFTAGELAEHSAPGDPPPADQPRVDWYDWRGLGAVAAFRAFAERLGVPPLAIEDALDIDQIPKYEERERSFLLTVPYLHLDAAGTLAREHLTFYWTPDLLLTVQERPDDLFAEIRERIRASLGRVRQRGTTYLAYALVDIVVDDYVRVLSRFEAACERLEDDILAGRDLERQKVAIHATKKEVNHLRRVLLPLREAVSRWSRSDHHLREDAIEPFLRDLLDNVLRAHDLAESFGARTSDLYALYTNELAVETNRIVQLLTVVSTIFIPLGFLAGLYGMNFAYIPELQYRHGYFVLLGVMATVAIGGLAWFRRRGWI